MALSSTSAQLVDGRQVPSRNATLQLSTQLTDQLENEQQQQQDNGSFDGTTNRRHSLLHNKEFKLEIARRLKRDYPHAYVLVCALVVIVLSAANVYFERVQADRFEFDDVLVISYRTLSGLALLAAIVNIGFSLLAILTGKSSIHN